LSVDKVMTMQGAAIATLDTVSVATTGTFNNGSSLLTVNTLTDNNGTIGTGIGGATIATMTNNHKTINGGTGLVIFTNAATTTAGTITAGAGGMVFNGAANLNGGRLTVPTGDTVRFANNLSVGTTGTNDTLSLAGTGRVSIGGVFTRGTNAMLTFPNTSTVVYYGTSQTIAPASYGNLVISGTGATTNKDTLTGNLTLNQNLTVGASDSLLITSAASTVGGTGEAIGKVTRSHSFTGGQYYAFNRDSVGLGLKLAAPAARTVTLNMQPGISPTDSLTLTRLIPYLS
jgi:hypothetical protein